MGLPSDAKRIRWFELSLVLLVAFAGAFLSSVYLLNNGPSPGPHISNARWSINIIHEITSLCLLRYVLSRRNLRFRDLGLRWSLRDGGLGVSLAGASYAMYTMGHALTHFLHNPIFSSARNFAPRDFFGHPAVLFVPFSILNPFFEELIVRSVLDDRSQGLNRIIGACCRHQRRCSIFVPPLLRMGGNHRLIFLVPNFCALLRAISASVSPYRCAWILRYLRFGSVVVGLRSVAIMLANLPSPKTSAACAPWWHVQTSRLA